MIDSSSIVRSLYLSPSLNFESDRLLDTNVLLDIYTDDSTWRPWSEGAVRDALVAGNVAINPIVYAETSLAFADTDALDSHLDALMLQRLALPYGAAFRAGRAFLRYRRAGGTG